MIKKTLTAAALATVAITGTAHARDQIQIVGSSTVYPFATVVAERFGKTTDYPTPVIESTGSGGGLKLFCAGVGVNHPDITNASRAIKASEIKNCADAGIDEITEVKIGYDGLTIANSKEATQYDLSKEQIYLALAKTVPNPDNPSELIDNPYKRWSEIDSGLPNKEIEVMGPPPTSGTRDAFVELVMEEGCESFDAVTALGGDKQEAVCSGMREDGRFVEAGENDTLIVNKLTTNHDALGIFGFSFLDANMDKIQGAMIDGVAPQFEKIASGEYPVSRPLFFYVKKAHVGEIPGMKEYLAEFTSDRAIGPDGYLLDVGLIPMDEAERAKYRDAAENLTDNVNL